MLAAINSPVGGAGSSAAPQAVFDRMKAKFPTAAIAVLELTGAWYRWARGRRG